MYVYFSCNHVLKSIVMMLYNSMLERYIIQWLIQCMWNDIEHIFWLPQDNFASTEMFLCYFDF